MAVVNVGTSITKALTKITGRIPRATLATWFNEIVADILAQPREWKFLTEPLSLAIVDNAVTVPAGVSEVLSIQVGTTAFFTQANQLSAKEAAFIDASGCSVPVGYVLSAAGVITFHPALTGTAELTVEHGVVGDYADNDETVFPLDFQNLFLSGLLKNAYYVDKDGRFTAESITYDARMSQMKAWDNRRKPTAHFNANGYLRAPQ